jgi:hypothetical protein
MHSFYYVNVRRLEKVLHYGLRNVFIIIAMH